MLAVEIEPHAVWIRVARHNWPNPIDTSYAFANGGRWNVPDTCSTLYLCRDIETARLRLQQMVAGTGIVLEDLRDDAYVAVLVTLPPAQHVADAVSLRGLLALGLPATYPRDETGSVTPHEPCQAIGLNVVRTGLKGVLARSSLSTDVVHQELAWFPALNEQARIVETRRFGDWRRPSVNQLENLPTDSELPAN